MILLSIDYSTTSTGYSVFDLTKKTIQEALLEYGILKPEVKGLTKLTYPRGALEKGISLGKQLKNLIEFHNPDKIVLEEINPGKNRLGQKTLCGGHFLFYYFNKDTLNKLHMLDSDGSHGWRSAACLNLKLSKNDKTTNVRRRKRNKETREAQHKKGIKRALPGSIIPIITKKHKAAEFVNSLFGTDFDVDKTINHADICDSIGLGVAYAVFVLKKYEL